MPTKMTNDTSSRMTKIGGGLRVDLRCLSIVSSFRRIGEVTVRSGGVAGGAVEFLRRLRFGAEDRAYQEARDAGEFSEVWT